MSAFPTGSWDLDDLDDVGIWAGELSRATPRACRPILSALSDLALRLAGLCDDSQYDDPGEDSDRLVADPPQAPGPTEKVIKVQPPVEGPPVRRAQGAGILNDPKVS